MKHSILFKSFFFTIILALFWSCDINNGDDPKPADKYLIDFEKHKSYLPAEIKSTLAPYIMVLPELKNVSDNVKHEIEIYKIKYITRFKGKELVASGLVAMPVTPGQYPIFSYQNGTNTEHSQAPTAIPDDNLYKLLEFVASTGFVIAFPDYIGFGYSSNNFHPYLDKESTVQSVTDMLRAVRELANHYEKTEITKDLYIAGYSQGGWATMALQQFIEENHASEFNLKASSCGAGPYDLNYINDHVLSQASYPMPYYIGYIFNSFIKTGDITIPASDVFKAPYDQKVMTLFDGKHSGGQINEQLTKVTADLFTAEYKTGSKTNPKFASVISTLNKNSIPAWKTKIPTLITHGSSDTYVPSQVSDKIYNDFLAKGVDPSKIKYTKIAGADHGSGVFPSWLETFTWFINIKEGK